MKIKVLNQIKIRGEAVNLFDYVYIDSEGSTISSVFQATKEALSLVTPNNVELSHFLDAELS